MSGKQKESRPAYLFLAPAILLITVFLVYPVGNIFYQSFQHFYLNNPYYNGFAGLDNFKKILTEDRIFYSSLLISSKWVVVQVGFQLIFGLILALLLNRSFKGRGLIRAIVFSPWAISGVLTSMMWSMMLNQQVGVINDLFMKIGLIKSPIAWTGNLKTVFWSVAVAELWRGIPFFAITMLAALQTIPAELYESCAVDGGGRWSSFTRITLPYLKETIIFSTLLRGVWEFNNVDLIYTMTGGGPANETTTLAMYIAQQATKFNNFGYGSALMVFGFGVMFVCAVIYLKLSHFGEEEQ